MAAEGVEILQILQESEDVLSWSRECSEREKKKGKVTFGTGMVSPSLGWAGLGWHPATPKCHCHLGSGCIWWLEAEAGKVGCHLPPLAESWEPPHFWDDGKELCTLVGLSAPPAPPAPQDHTTLTLGKKGSWRPEQDGMWAWKCPSRAQDAPQTLFSKTGD